MDKRWSGKPALSILANKEEDRFTEYFAHLLKSKRVLLLFLEKFFDLQITENQDFIIDTQVTISGGRPDIVIQNDNYLIIIESKVSSMLHENQLIPYANFLNRWQQEDNDRKTKLCLLVPEAGSYLHYSFAKKQLEELDGHELEPHLLTWENIAVFCDKVSSQVTDVRLSIYLEDFHSLVEKRLGLIDRPFTEEEIFILGDPLLAKSILRVAKLSDAIRDILKSNPDFKLASSTGIGFQGHTVRFKERWWWVGIWLDIWANYGISPLVFQLPCLDSANKLFEIVGPNLVKEYTSRTSDGLMLNLVLRSDVSLDQLAKEFADLIILICEELPESGCKS